MLQKFIDCYPDIKEYSDLSITFLWGTAAPSLAAIIGAAAIPKIIRAVFGGI